MLGIRTQTSWFFCQCSFICCGINKRPVTMYKPKPTFRHPSHRLVIYNFRYHSYIYHTYTINIFHSHQKKKVGLKYTSELITQKWKLIYGKWLQHSKFKHAGTALGKFSRKIILDVKITDKHEQGQDTLP